MLHLGDGEENKNLKLLLNRLRDWTDWTQILGQGTEIREEHRQMIRPCSATQ